MTRRSNRRNGGGLAPERIVQAAVEAYLGGAQPERDGRPEREERSRRGSGVSALALGMAIGVGARVAYRRARGVDLAQVARAVERRMVN